MELQQEKPKRRRESKEGRIIRWKLERKYTSESSVWTSIIFPVECLVVCSFLYLDSGHCIE